MQTNENESKYWGAKRISVKAKLFLKRFRRVSRIRLTRSCSEISDVKAVLRSDRRRSQLPNSEYPKKTFDESTQ